MTLTTYTRKKSFVIVVGLNVGELSAGGLSAIDLIDCRMVDCPGTPLNGAHIQ